MTTAASVQRLLRRFLWVGAPVALSCDSVTEPAGGDVASLGVTPPSATITVGSTLPLRASVHDQAGRAVTGASIFWSVRDEKVASVSADGIVTGRATGSTEVAASAGGKSAIAVVIVQPVPVAAVHVQPKTAALTTGGRVQLTATARDASDAALTDRTIVWSSSDDALATVSPTGMVTALAPGVVTITATAEGKTDAATVTITPVPVVTVEVMPDPLALSVGQTAQIVAIARDASGGVLTGRAITWETSNPSVATVSAQGSVAAVGAGVATITATIEGKTGRTTLTVSNLAVGSVTVAPLSSTLTPRGSAQLTATVRDVSGALVVDRPVVWSSSDAAVATVSQSGVVTAVAVGSAAITATSEGRAGSAAVEVVAGPLATIEVDPAAVSIVAQQAVTLTVTLKDADGFAVTGRPVTFTSADDAVATVSPAGVVTGIAPGSTTIVVASEGKSAQVPVTVTAVPVATVTVTPATASIATLATVTLSAIVKDAGGRTLTGRPVTWSSSQPLVAAVSQSGVVTGLLPGTATITATSEGRSGSATVTVNLLQVGSVTVQPSTVSVASGSTTTLAATVRDQNGAVVPGAPVTWSSSDPAVAGVSSTGAVTGARTGTATVTASAGGKSGTSNVTVTAGPLAAIRVSPTSATIEVGDTRKFTALGVDAAGNAVGGTITFTWTSSDASIANITSAGQATGKKPGTVTITATGGGLSGTATLKVER